MAEIEVEIVGLERLTTNLETLRRIATENLVDIAYVGALPFLNAAKERTPVLTGTLKRSEHIGGFGSRGTGAGDFISSAVVKDGGGDFGYSSAVLGAYAKYGGGITPATRNGRVRAKHVKAVDRSYGDVGGPVTTETRATLKIGTNLHYAWPVERRKPYLRPAFDNPAARQESARGADQAFKKIVRAALAGGAT